MLFSQINPNYVKRRWLGVATVVDLGEDANLVVQRGRGIPRNSSAEQPWCGAERGIPRNAVPQPWLWPWLGVATVLALGEGGVLVIQRGRGIPRNSSAEQPWRGIRGPRLTKPR